MNDKSRREATEAFLAGDPRVDAYVFAETDSSLRVVATPAAGWLAAQRRRAGEALSAHILTRWRTVYERSYRWDGAVRAPDFGVWVSSFDKKQIPVERMQVWLDDVMAKLRALPHDRVLDVGCGVGLVLAALAPTSTSYAALDFSEEAVASLGAWVATQPFASRVRLARRAAHEPEGPEGDRFDLAVLNSVVQYFPDVDYLTAVLDAVAERVDRGGAVFLGDLRALFLLPMRAANVAAARAPEDATAERVREDARIILGMTRELAADPGFFRALASRSPRFGAAEFSFKPREADHELSGYRYDALLRLDRPDTPPAPIIEAASVDELLDIVDLRHPDAAVVLGLPNARLAYDAAFARCLETADGEIPIAALKAEATGRVPTGVEPGALQRALEARLWEAQMRFSPGAADGRFDVLIRRPGVEARWPETQAVQAAGGPFVNDPLGEELRGQLRIDLQHGLDGALGVAGRVRVELTHV